MDTITGPDRITIEPHGSRVVPWEPGDRSGNIDDRRMREVTVRLPPRVSALDVTIPAALSGRLETAIREIASLDESHGAHLGALSTLLLRNESVASSKIEHIEATVDDYARALHGIRSNESATSMVASTEALAHLICSVRGGANITIDNMQRAHRVLMADDPYERAYAGRFRDMQNWIGGSDHAPREALYVPPPPELVDELITDLMLLANRDDLSSLVQAALVHAQFESIHPYTDGNGRIGRALVNTVLRRRGVTNRVVVPLAAALVARRDHYFATLGAYREGDAGPIVEAFTHAAAIAAAESRITAERIAAMPDTWRDAVRPRRGTVADKLLDALPDNPIFSAEDAETFVRAATSSVYAGITRLEEAGVIRPLTTRSRNQVWGSSALLDELNDLSIRIGARAQKTAPS